MKKQLFLLIVLSNFLWSADNEISIDQSGATLNADIEQLGSGN